MILNILIAEDEAYSRRVLTSLLKKMRPDYKIISVENGQQALECMKETEFHMLITDIEMPIINGVKLMGEICERHINIKVIVLSGYNHFEYAQKALKYNAVDYILKPIDPDKILEVIEKVENQILREQKKLLIDKKLKSICNDYLSNTLVKNNKIVDKDELKNLFGENFNDFFKGEEESSQGTFVMNNVIEYINKNYQMDISLESVSTTFHFNPSYFSVLFKKSMGCNFTDYIKKTRIKEAKEMLKNTDKKVYEIAAHVGYRDYQYFCRLFKKINKVTPSEYRRIRD